MKPRGKTGGTKLGTTGKCNQKVGVIEDVLLISSHQQVGKGFTDVTKADVGEAS